MFRKLRVKFIAIVMVSVAAVLMVVFTGICVSEYQRNAADVEEALSTSLDIVSQSFRNAEDSDEPAARATQGDGPDDGDDSGDEHSRGPQGAQRPQHRPDGLGGPRIGGRDSERRVNVPVAVYELGDSGEPSLSSDFATASIEEEVLKAAAERLAELDDGQGTFSDLGLHYKKRTVSSRSYVAFADTSTTDSWRTLALTLGVAGAGTLVVFFLISLALSKWALRPVKEAWDSQRQFVADASHDLKTPLTVILANASILLKHPERSIASESQWIESTQVEAEHMQGLVNEMLELAQVESAQELQTAPHASLDFSDLVDGETLLFDSLALERGCSFDCSIEAGIKVSGNAQQLQKMCSTLIENAFKYAGDGGRVDIALHREGKRAVLTVRNTGSTISPDDLPHIFDRFYRTDKARTSGAGGFGLGLAIAREVARSHGGDIACTSDNATGTTFSVTLPAL